jgi:eukaryotic-like serine/threonine-protein kinase
MDPDKTFPVGLIYGPSGCGKSSLVKAGLLPRLSEQVIAVYLEATPHETEAQLLHALRKSFPALREGLNLREAVAALRRGQGIPVGKKALIVLDQFEQWLHAQKSEEEGADLAPALRHCDGGRVQCIVMVRDDFWMAATRFMRALDVRILEGQNSAAVDLFSMRHAEKVLAAFGRAFGALSDDTSQSSKDQDTFLKQSVLSLAEEGKVICVRLALFAEMIKAKPWTSATLREVGGAEGVGASFLEETFSVAARPELRLHQRASRAILAALLPDTGTDIKGQMRTRQALMDASGYRHRPQDFDALLRLLDAELRLITPIGPEEPASPATTLGEAATSGCFQLTHDYLVPSLREWLSRKQRATRRGRAELRLAEQAALWHARPEGRYLPSLWEWANIRLLTRRKHWTPLQRAMLPVDATQAPYLAGRLLQASAVELPVIRDALRPYQLELMDQLWEELTGLRDHDGDSSLAAAGALAMYAPSDPRWASAARAAADDLVSVNPVFLGQWMEHLRPVRRTLTEPLVDIYRDPQRSETERRLATNVLADYARDMPVVLTELLLDADAHASMALYPVVERHAQHAVTRLEAELAKTASPDAGYAERDRLARRQAHAAAALLRLGSAEKVWPMLQHSADPSSRSYLVNAAASLGVDSGVLARKYYEMSAALTSTPAAEASTQDGLLFHPQTSPRRALILALGKYDADDFPARERERLVERLLEDYRNDGDPGVHSAAEWALRRWGRESQLQEAEAALLGGIRGERGWHVNGQGQLMVVIEGPIEFRMGSPPDEPDRIEAHEAPHHRRINRRFAIAAKEVSIEQYERFLQENPQHNTNYLERYSTGPRSSQVSITWYDAVAYCNWLSRQEGLEPCFEPNEAGEFAPGLRLASGFLERSGYRLPTEAEWEYACRAGARTSRFYGDSVELLAEYAWFNANSQDRAWPGGLLKPNDLGLFDFHGNAWEWVLDVASPYPSDGPAGGMLDEVASGDVIDQDIRILRGGAFGFFPANVRAADRFMYQPSVRDNDYGFRIARTIAPENDESGGR